MMKVLFVSSGNSLNGISPIIQNQGNSLIKNGIELCYFTIKEKGVIGYLKTIPKLKKYLKENKFDVVHAHYSLSAYVATLSMCRPLVVSLMGSDVMKNGYNKLIIKFFNYFFWDATIVKSQGMKSSLGIKNVFVIPNGVDFNKFQPMHKSEALSKTKWDKTRSHILFAANPHRKVKNFELAKRALDKINNTDIELHYLDNIENSDMPFFYNSADVVLLTSVREGSPNVIKEAMACSRPIVSTDVGDVLETIGNTRGCYVCKSDPVDLGNKINSAINYGSKTLGRESISHLNEKIIAERIIEIYKNLIN